MELKSIDVLGKRYKITKAKHKEMPEDLYMGLCCDDVSKIYLNKNLREGEEYWTTLFHEFGHAIMYRNGLRFSGAIPIEIEEIIVETIASGYYTLVKQILKEMTKDGSNNISRDKILSFSKAIR